MPLGPVTREILDEEAGALLAGVVGDALEIMRSTVRERHFAPGQPLFIQHDRPSQLLILRSGRVKVWRPLKDGGALTLTLLTRGAPLGTLGAIRDTPHHATATAQGDVTALAWPIEAVRKTMQVDHCLSSNLLLIVTNYAEQMIERLEESSTIPVEQRLARTLMRLSYNPWDGDAPSGDALPLSRQDLADLTQTTLPTASRIMSRWRGEGLIGGGRGRVLIRDWPGLAALAALPSDWRRPIQSALAVPT